jgi:hypothetical protein
MPTESTCQCDRCVRWPLSEVEPTSREWLVFELRRPLDSVDGAPASWSETLDAGADPDTGEPVAA